MVRQTDGGNTIPPLTWREPATPTKRATAPHKSTHKGNYTTVANAMVAQTTFHVEHYGNPTSIGRHPRRAKGGTHRAHKCEGGRCPCEARGEHCPNAVRSVCSAGSKCEGGRCPCEARGEHCPNAANSTARQALRGCLPMLPPPRNLP